MESIVINFDEAKICMECKVIYRKNAESSQAPNIGPCGHKAGIKLSTYIEVMSKQGKEVRCA